MQRLRIGAVAAALVAFGSTSAQASCGSAFCFVNTNWSLQGIWTQPGPHVDFRYAFVSVPVYRYVNGVQLTANWSAAGGLSVQF